MLILNSPHNPTGKVFTLAELEAIAEIVRAHPNLIVISDEVYKFSVYNPLEAGDPSSTGHYHFARLPGNVHLYAFCFRVFSTVLVVYRIQYI